MVKRINVADYCVNKYICPTCLGKELNYIVKTKKITEFTISYVRFISSKLSKSNIPLFNFDFNGFNYYCDYHFKNMVDNNFEIPFSDFSI